MLRLALVCTLTLSIAASASAQCVISAAPVVMSTHSVSVTAQPGLTSQQFSGGLLGTLNAPLIPGLPAVPGLPSPSVLGLVAPRLSMAASFVQAGGFNGPNATTYLVGAAFPRIAPLVALQAGTIQPQQALLAVAAPRLAAGVQLLQASGLGGGRMAGRCR
jgi:hypothetical protein